MKKGIIIQGPIITYGQGPNNNPLGFNSVDIIQKNIKQIKDNGFSYIIVTWKNEVLNEDFNVLVLDEPENDPDHRFKQKYAALRGAEYLINTDPDIELLIRIRTDMLMPESFWIWINSLIEIDGKIIVSQLMRGFPFYIGDFIYVGLTSDFLEYFRNFVSFGRKNLHPSIAFDEGLKFQYLVNKQLGYYEFLKSFLYFLCCLIFKKNDSIKRWNNLLENLSVMPREIWEQIVWREKRIECIISSDSFKFDTLKEDSNLYSLRTFEQDYRRYCDKRNIKPFFYLLINIFRKLKEVVKKVLAVPKRIVNAYIYIYICKPVILSRTACLGNDVVKLFSQEKYMVVNQQKSRVDTFLRSQKLKMPAAPSLIEPHMERKDIFPLIEQQIKNPWLKVNRNNVKYFIMDSFSELVDQQFTCKESGWSFDCVYTDINHSDDFRALFSEDGLVDLSSLKKSYEDFFSWVKTAFKKVQIIFIHFPAKFDKREKFVERAEYIKKVIDAICDVDKSIINIRLQDSDIEKSLEDDFPYHLSENTKSRFLCAINTALASKE